jgi:hypothetical protein
LLPTGFEVAVTGRLNEQDAKNIEQTAKNTSNLFFIFILFFSYSYGFSDHASFFRVGSELHFIKNNDKLLLLNVVDIFIKV